MMLPSFRNPLDTRCLQPDDLQILAKAIMAGQEIRRLQHAEQFQRAMQAAERGGSRVQHERCLAEWQFIEKRKSGCTPWEKRYLLEYELAREAGTLGLAYRSTATWQQLFGNQFPDKPFISINPAERLGLLKSAFTEGSGAARLHDFTAEWSPLSYQADYVLTGEYQAELEGITEEIRDEMNIDAGQQALRAAVAKFMAGLPEAAYEPSVARVEMTIHFDYSDKKIKEAFAELLASLRRGDHLPGKKDEIDANLKRLAVARLYRIFGTVAAAQDYLTDCGFEFPYAGDAGWTQARTAVSKMLGLKGPISPVRPPS